MNHSHGGGGAYGKNNILFFSAQVVVYETKREKIMASFIGEPAYQAAAILLLC
jgi:hypothetical protein